MRLSPRVIAARVRHRPCCIGLCKVTLELLIKAAVHDHVITELHLLPPLPVGICRVRTRETTVCYQEMIIHTEVTIHLFNGYEMAIIVMGYFLRIHVVSQ